MGFTGKCWKLAVILIAGLLMAETVEAACAGANNSNQYITGWAQRRVTDATGNCAAVSGIFGVGVSPITLGLATTQPFEFSVVGGQSISIRWGYDDPNNVFGENLATNTITADLRVFYETQSTNLLEAAATDTFSAVGNATTPPNTLDRTLTFTASHTGTLRIWVRLHGFVTAGSTNINDVNSDGGTQFGGPAEAVTTATLVDFRYGLIRAGGRLTSETISNGTTSCPSSCGSSGLGNAVFNYPDSLTNTFVSVVGPRVNDGTYSVAWESSPGTVFATQSIAATTATTRSTAAFQVAPVNNFPASNNNTSIKFSPDNSVLSLANSGVGLPWTHIDTNTPTSPGTVVTTLDPAGNVVAVEFQNAVFIDPRLRVHSHTQKSTPLVKDTPPGTQTDSLTFIISADLFKGYAHVSNAANVNQGSITTNVHLADPTITSPTTQTVSTGSGDNVPSSPLNNTDATGWTAASPVSTAQFAFTPSPPSGTWHYYVANATDGTSTWNGNNLVRDDTNTEPSGNFAGFKRIGFISAYTANRALAIQVANEVAPGVATTINVEYLQSDGTIVVQDFAPTIRVFTVNSNGSQTDSLAAVAMTPIGNNGFSIMWTPATTGTFIVEVRATVSSAGVEGTTQVNVRARDTFDPTGLFK